jgi:hypothetical protein
MGVGERILQIGVWSAAVDGAAAVAADGGGDVAVVPFLVGLAAQYMLGLSPVSTKLWNYSSTLLPPPSPSPSIIFCPVYWELMFLVS